MIDPGVVLNHTEAGVGVGSDKIVQVGMDPGGVVFTIIVSVSLSFVFQPHLSVGSFWELVDGFGFVQWADG